MLRIAIVDDHPIFSKAVQEILKFHFDVKDLAAESFLDVESFLASNTIFDLVLLDLLMPRVDNIQTIKHIKKTNPASKILVLSSVDDAGKISEVVQAGADGYLNKQNDGGQIADAIEKVLKGELIVRVIKSRKRLKPELQKLTHTETKTPISQDLVELEAICAKLTRREKQVLQQIFQAQSIKEISASLFISSSTVKLHISALLNKFQVDRRAKLILLKKDISQILEAPL